MTILCANPLIQARIAFVGFRGVIPDEVAQAIREQAAPKEKEKAK